jgi:hypothetical protein
MLNLHASETTGSQMHSERIRDQDTLWTQDDDSTVYTMPRLDEISHSTALMPAKATIAAMAAMAVMASKAVMAEVTSSTGIQDYGNHTVCRQDVFGTSTESRLAGIWVSIVLTPSEVNFGSTPSESLRSTPSEELRLTPSEELKSTLASSG